jgi:hypothetical protein
MASKTQITYAMAKEQGAVNEYVDITIQLLVKWALANGYTEEWLHIKPLGNYVNY